MALRVLLADESSTIKKVFQLALQDYAVEVKPVALGVDVQSVAMDFQPDVIFADILLQKKNGYEVCAELKSNDELKSIPVVLMWSGFMELDRDKFEACGADGRLEKPFDVTQLRKIVSDLVSKTKTQPLSQFLDFPDTPDFEEQKPPAPPQEEEVIQAESSEEEDDFRQVSIPKINTQKEKFQISAPEEDEAEFELEAASVANEVSAKPPEELNVENLEIEEPDDEDDDEDFSFLRPGTQTGVAPSTQAASTSSYDLKPEEVREIVERLAPKIIEEIVWKIVPDLASQIIEREIKNLLAEKDAELSP